MTPDPTEIILTNDTEFLSELLDLVIVARKHVTEITEIMRDRAAGAELEAKQCC